MRNERWKKISVRDSNKFVWGGRERAQDSLFSTSVAGTCIKETGMFACNCIHVSVSVDEHCDL